MHRRIEEQFERSGCTGAIHVCRLSDGAELAVRADDLWLAASVIKVAVGLEFYAQASEGRLDPTRPVTLRAGQRTPGPTGISTADDDVTMSLRDLCASMLAVSDNAATDAVLAAVGIDAVNDRLTRLGCSSTVLVESIGDSIDRLAAELGFTDYATLLLAQSGDLGEDALRTSTDEQRIDSSSVLDPAAATRTTARDMTRLLSAVWQNRAAPEVACASLRTAMGQQVTRRLATAVPEGGQLAAKSGALFGRVRNEVGIITDPEGEHHAFAVLTRPLRPFVGVADIDMAMARAASLALETL